MSEERLTREAAAARLDTLEHWELEPERPVIVGRFRFGSFPEAIGFVNKVAAAAEAMNHHPDIDIRYRNVTLALTTHRVDGLTQLDLDLAGQVELLAAG